MMARVVEWHSSMIHLLCEKTCEWNGRECRDYLCLCKADKTSDFYALLMETSTRFIHAREMAGKFGFFQGQGIVRNYVMCQKRMKFCKNIREMSENSTFQPDEIWIFGHDVAFLLNS